MSNFSPGGSAEGGGVQAVMLVPLAKSLRICRVETLGPGVQL